MISLRKLIDATQGSPAASPNSPDARSNSPDARSKRTGPVTAALSNGPKGTLAQTSPASALNAHLSALASMGVHGQRAIPALGTMISSALARVIDNLSRSPTPEALSESQRQVDEQLCLWADQAQSHQKEGEQTIRELLRVVEDAAQSTGTRDEKYGREIAALSERLRATVGIDSLPVIRRSISESATALNTCAAKMADEGRESVRRLTAEITEYQTRLQASERRALVDPLTGISNRRGFEERLEACVAAGQPFSLLLADLNNFKAANDTHGHLVGDEILRQFAGELKAQFRPDDAVGRWGGDEFVALIVGPAKEAGLRADRVRHWALGDYKITLDGKTTVVKVSASLGTVTWNGTESGQELFARADREMYLDKESFRNSDQPVALARA